MFEYIKGTLAQKDPNHAVVDVQGIGYLISISLSTYSNLPEVDESIILYTSFIVREDAQILYGFSTKQERVFFERVITVSGIGPKIGLTLIGHLDLATLQDAIHANNVALITKVPGIGKKTAGSHLLSDAVQALTNLGYHPMHAQRAVQAVMSKDIKDLGKIITAALQVI